MTNQAKSVRKSSAEINRTVNAFVQQANRFAIDGYPRKEDGEQKPYLGQQKTYRPAGKTTPKQIVEMQGGYFKSNPLTVQTKITSGTRDKGRTATVSLAKDAETSGFRTDQSPTTGFPTKKLPVPKTSKEVRMAGFGPAKGNKANGDVNRSHQSTSANTIRKPVSKYVNGWSVGTANPVGNLSKFILLSVF